MKKLSLSIILALVSTLISAQTLSLDSCKTLAIQNNKHLREAYLKSEASAQVKKNAFTNYFPKVDAGAVAMRSNKYLLEASLPEMNLPVYDGNPVNLPTATEFAYFPGMDISMLDYTNAAYIMAIQPLYMGGKIRNGNKLAGLGQEISEYTIHLTTDEVLAKTEAYYWSLVGLMEKKKTLNSYQKMLKELLSDVTVSYEAGIIQKSDVLKVKYKLSKVNGNELQIDNGITLLKMMLCQQMGIPFNENLQPENLKMELLPPSTVFMKPQEALVQRYEYQMLNTSVEAERLQRQMAIGENLPQLAVGVQGLYLDIIEDQNTYGIAFATLSIPISGWWGGSHKIQEHKIKMNIAQNDRDEKSELMILQINKAYNDLNESFEQINVAQKSLEEANEYLNVVSNNYEAGIISTSDLLEAQTMQQQSHDELVNAKTNYKIKMAKYLESIAQRNM